MPIVALLLNLVVVILSSLLVLIRQGLNLVGEGVAA